MDLMEFTSEEQFNSQAFSVCPCSVIFRGEQEQGKSVNVNVKEREREREDASFLDSAEDPRCCCLRLQSRDQASISH